MPRTQFQRMVFALLTVIITVHAYVFYSLYVVNGSTLMSITKETSVLNAIRANGGIYMFAHSLPVWAVILVEFIFAYLLEIVMGSPCSLKMASKAFDVNTTHHMIFESAVICSTIILMCPAMSFIAAFLYYPYYMGFNIFTLLANWLKLVCFNFPFALFTQLFIIQPVVRRLFKLIFAKDIKAKETAGQ